MHEPVTLRVAGLPPVPLGLWGGAVPDAEIIARYPFAPVGSLYRGDRQLITAPPLRGFKNPETQRKANARAHTPEAEARRHAKRAKSPAVKAKRQERWRQYWIAKAAAGKLP